jgi:hypothetical protein
MSGTLHVGGRAVGASYFPSSEPCFTLPPGEQVRRCRSQAMTGCQSVLRKRLSKPRQESRGLWTRAVPQLVRSVGRWGFTGYHSPRPDMSATPCLPSVPMDDSPRELANISQVMGHDSVKTALKFYIHPSANAGAADRRDDERPLEGQAVTPA